MESGYKLGAASLRRGVTVASPMLTGDAAEQTCNSSIMSIPEGMTWPNGTTPI
jgi:hypothetical protein